MASFFKKYMLLLWKDWLIQIRHWIKTLVQIFIPVLGGVLVIFLRNLILPTSINHPTIYKPLPLNDMSILGLIPVYPGFEYSPSLAYSPKNEVLQEFIETVLINLKFRNTGNVSALQNKKDLESFLVINPYFAGIEFDDSLNNISVLPKNLEYSLRFPGELRTNASLSWRTEFVFPKRPSNKLLNPDDFDGGNPAGYFREGFLTLQNVIFQAFLDKFSVKPNTVPDIFIQRFPYPPYDSDDFTTFLEALLPLILIISLFYIFSDTVKIIAVEKERQLHESMKIMGLTNSLHWMAWFTKSIIIFVITISIITVIYCGVKTEKVNINILDKSNWFLIWLFLLAYSIATIMFSFLLSVFFSKGNTAAAVAALIFVVTYSFYIIFRKSYDNLDFSEKMLLSLFSNTAMCFGIMIILRHEGAGFGLQWDNLFSPVNINDNLAVGHLMIMLLVDALIYLLLCLYIEKVFPGKYGIAEPCNFFLKKKFWTNKVNNDTVLDHIPDDKLQNIEEVPPGFKAGVKIRGLTKVYINQKEAKVAVKDLYLDMYEDQITILLGHNGAGKTTTMSMLTGMFPPTSGTAIINDEDIRKNIDGVRSSLGLCLQHNVLFDELTVYEHMVFFGRLKGMNKSEIGSEGKRIVNALGLLPKINEKSSTLSGGMKRRLAVGVALIGGSKVVFLDEPTSGMDPTSRRALWDLLIREKRGRTILLSTHFMDEADVLGDRVAIMSEGELKACGSPFYLKKKFGVGYRLICVKETNCIPDRVTETLNEIIPDLKIETNIGSELSYILSEEFIKKFQYLLALLENNSEFLGISSYGISLTTLEEVFHKVGSDSNYVTTEIEQDSLMGFHATNLIKPSLKLWINQIKAIFLKKFYSTRRNLLILGFIFFIPFLFTVIALVTEVLSKDQIIPPPLLITTSSYKRLNILLHNVHFADNGTFNQYEEFGNRVNVKISNVDTKLENYILKLSENNLSNINRYYIVAASLLKNKFIAWFNNKAYHAAPLSLSLIHNAVLKSTCGPSCGISVTNKPLPLRPKTRLNRFDTFGTLGYRIAEMLAMALAFVGGLIIMFYIRERVSRAKLLQFLSGVNIFIFWGVSFLWDYMIFLLVSLVCIGTMAAFQKENFSSARELSFVFLILVFTGWSLIPITYCFSLVFQQSASGFVKFSILFLFLGLTSFAILTIMSFDPDLKDLTATLVKYFMISPLFAFADAIFKFERITAIRTICESNVYLQNLPQCKDLDEFKWEEGITRNLVYMFVVGIVVSIYLLLWDYGFFKKIKKICKAILGRSFNKCRKIKHQNDVLSDDQVSDNDVLAEKNAIESIEPNQLKAQNLVIKNMTKIYKGTTKAVNQLYLQVNDYECFGLLGVNGAGKTTTFKMLTGDISITSGEAWIKGISMKTKMNEAYKHIGYCPQFDALLNELTGRETVEIFALIRGVHQYLIQGLGEKLANELNVMQHYDKPVEAYSGGSKRKLSTIVSLLGNPSVVYLDEPTTGMDPGARRQFWDVINKLRGSGLSIVLTSHSMDECEALCTRLAIMVDGEFKCLGSTQHLKNKFLSGYLLNIKMKRLIDFTKVEVGEYQITQNEANEEVKKYIMEMFPGSTMKEEHFDSISYQIPKSDLKWSEMFAIMEEGMTKHQIEDYSLGQENLEQVFLYFTQYSKSDIM